MNVKAETLDHDSGGRERRRAGVVEVTGSLDPQLWHACAGGMVQLPSIGAKVVYFPQGHAEQASTTPEFPTSLGPWGTVPCQVVSVRFMADIETDEVFARLRLQPEPGSSMYLNGRVVEEEDMPPPPRGRPASFAKTLTQSDANNGGGFSVPRYCAETIFPPLDYNADPPVQTVLAKDVHGNVWKFRHIYRGTPRRHLLTTGWSTFVNQKRLVAGDAIVFLRGTSGELCVGVRRSMRGTAGSDSSAWHSSITTTSSMLVKGTESIFDYNAAAGTGGGENTVIWPGGITNSSTSSFAQNHAQVTAKSVLEAAMLAVAGKPFEVVYYPRASTAEFCVKASLVKQALDQAWCGGMRFKMAFETEDSSRVSWFMGTISAVQPADPILWPNSPWRVLQVTWDEPDLLQGVGRVSPWQVELVATLPLQLPPLPVTKKKSRPALQSELMQLQPPGLPNGLPINNFVPGQLPALLEDASAGMQGARHDHIYGLFVPDFRPGYKHPHDFLPDTTNNFHAENVLPARAPLLPDPRIFSSLPDRMSLPVANVQSERSNTTTKSSPSSFFLFGQSISPAQGKDQLCGDLPFLCKVFRDCEEVGRTLDLSKLATYEELYERLAVMFSIPKALLHDRVVYKANGFNKGIGHESYRNFATSVKRIFILSEPERINVTLS
ncbi:unnamed protein product [Sphagnum troendelagicum]